MDWIKIESKILDVFKTSGEKSFSTNQIGELVQIHHSTAKKHLKLMEFHGIVERTTNGRVTLWSLATKE